jgi:hypothetical protein
MNNITGSAAKWVNDEDKTQKRVLDKKTINDEIEKNEIDIISNIEQIGKLMQSIEIISNNIDEIYEKLPKKDISDSSIMLKSVIRSLRNVYNKN